VAIQSRQSGLAAVDDIADFESISHIPDMRVLMLAWLPLLVGACRDEQPIDCTAINLPTINRCFEQNRAKGEVFSVVACLPFSERLTTRGVWVVGFEKNDFFEQSFTPPSEIMWTASTGSSLIVDDKIQQRVAPVDSHLYAFEVNVVGRRALCPVGDINAYPIAVEKLKITGRIGRR
jgi:hypothetical protein